MFFNHHRLTIDYVCLSIIYCYGGTQTDRQTHAARHGRYFIAILDAFIIILVDCYRSTVIRR